MAKWDKLRKLSRNKALREYAAQHPELSADEIGQVYGITRQRVLQILGKKPDPVKEPPIGGEYASNV